MEQSSKQNTKCIKGDNFETVAGKVGWWGMIGKGSCSQKGLFGSLASEKQPLTWSCRQIHCFTPLLRSGHGSYCFMQESTLASPASSPMARSLPTLCSFCFSHIDLLLYSELADARALLPQAPCTCLPPFLGWPSFWPDWEQKRPLAGLLPAWCFPLWKHPVPP